MKLIRSKICSRFLFHFVCGPQTDFCLWGLLWLEPHYFRIQFFRKKFLQKVFIFRRKNIRRAWQVKLLFCLFCSFVTRSKLLKKIAKLEYNINFNFPTWWYYFWSKSLLEKYIVWKMKLLNFFDFLRILKTVIDV